MEAASTPKSPGELTKQPAVEEPKPRKCYISTSSDEDDCFPPAKLLKEVVNEVNQRWISMLETIASDNTVMPGPSTTENSVEVCQQPTPSALWKMASIGSIKMQLAGVSKLKDQDSPLRMLTISRIKDSYPLMMQLAGVRNNPIRKKRKLNISWISPMMIQRTSLEVLLYPLKLHVARAQARMRIKSVMVRRCVMFLTHSLNGEIVTFLNRHPRGLRSKIYIRVLSSID
ncbi:uncharacterized protein LOC133365311 [Rhineura floridana]|uniref:uncharacterized protein LOC133365311 n=1 Tax=Rhineura floridana TaxID=261503 RepID=UPI002AC7ED53|nr:uncharacterized protein LOC133365311 [Rhineura floridana]